MTILIYTPVSFSCKDLESLAYALRARGVNVMLLSLALPGPIHSRLREAGIPVFSRRYRGPAFLKLVRDCYYLWSFCRSRKVDIVHSHLEPTNFIVVLMQWLINAKVVVSRHHTDLARLANFDRSFTYRFTYRFAPRIVSVSRAAMDYMVKVEKVDEARVVHIDLGYDFRLFDADVEPSPRLARMMLIFIGRLDRFKCPDVAIEVLRRVVEHGIDAHLTILGTGVLLDELKLRVANLQLCTRVAFQGHVDNVFPFLKTADLLLHPSVSESSSVAIKEAAVAAVPVVVCKGTGDFDEYVQHGITGFCVDRDEAAREMTALILDHYDDRAILTAAGHQLRDIVMRRFAIGSVIDKYLLLYDELRES